MSWREVGVRVCIYMCVYLQFNSFCYFLSPFFFHFKAQQTKTKPRLAIRAVHALVGNNPYKYLLTEQQWTVAASPLLCTFTEGITSRYGALLGQTTKDNKQRHRLRTRHINNSRARARSTLGARAEREKDRERETIPVNVCVWQQQKSRPCFPTAQGPAGVRSGWDRWGELDKSHKTHNWHVGWKKLVTDISLG